MRGQRGNVLYVIDMNEGKQSSFVVVLYFIVNDEGMKCE